ncbi:Riboflavin transporter MCH5 [Hypsizygus marmoreus]|uniref:Riboflavin transporter MCH5 n=1 Tax=Hypsizygus marmoreus TaxID=39966 RepID=A0A369J7G4_HYPMA|nr:Riboflavin transporter MCH5 [Hypsizygus marmoreus]
METKVETMVVVPLDGEKSGGSTIERSQQENHEEEFQEGGLVGWATVAGAFIVQFCGFGYTTSFGVYQDFYTRIYITNESPSAISWIGSVNAFLVVACGVLAGRLYDKGYFYHLMYGGSFLISFSLFMLSCAKPNQFYQASVGAGIGAGVMYVPSIAVISHYFCARRAMAMTIVAAGSSFGAVIHPIMLNNMINGSLGFANATRVSAAMVSVLLLIACLLLRTRPPRGGPPTIALGKALRKFSRDWPYIVSIIGSSLFLLGYYFPLFYLQLDAVSHGLSEEFAFYALVIMSVASVAGRLISGAFVRRLGVGNMVLLSTGCCAVLIFAMIGLRTAASVVVLAVLYGFFAGMYIALIAPLLALLSDDISELGIRMGVGLGFSGIGVLTGKIISHHLHITT